MAELYGMEIEDLPADVRPVEAVVIIKVMTDDPDAEYPWMLCSRATEGLSVWEALGMSEWMRLKSQDQMRNWGETEEDENG